MIKIVFIGAGSGFGHRSLADINASHLEPVAAYARKLVAHWKAPIRITTALEWRNGALDGFDELLAADNPWLENGCKG
jgi:hypothetical protein